MHCAHCGTQTRGPVCDSCEQPARLADRYALEAMIGRGAHGTTWRAVDCATGDTRAIKELPLRLGVPDKTIALFKREAQVLTQLDHPGLPHCYEAFETGTGRHRALWIVLELIDGPTLAQELAAHRYDQDEVLAIVEELLGTLDWLHRRSPPVVHRDLKPANVIRAADGRLVLVDFGSVRDALHDPDAGGSTITGTFGYMAPEQFAGDAEPRTDLFGLGALAIRLLTRREPHHLQDARGTLNWRQHAQVTPVAADFLDRLTAAEIADRPASARAARHQLQRLRGRSLDGESLEAVGLVPEAPARLTRRPGRRFSLAGSGSVVFTRRHHERAVALIEQELGLSGELTVFDDGMTWSTKARHPRQIQVTIEPSDGGSAIVITEDHRALWAGLLGGMAGGIGGGVGGGVGWMVFAFGGAMMGFAFLGGVLGGAVLLACAIGLTAKRARAASLVRLRDALEGRLHGPVTPQASLPRIPHPAGFAAGAGVLGSLATAMLLLSPTSISPPASLILGLFIVAVLPAGFSLLPGRHQPPSR